MSFASILYTVILYPLIQIINLAYFIFDMLFHNVGIAVIGVSFTVTLLCLPLYVVAEKWQQIQRDTEAKLKPGIDRIKAVFKGDEQYMILSTYYKQNHYHPIMALRSSFGLLIQIPFFMAAYSCLSKMPALQGQSFLFIADMGKQDALFHIGNFPVNVLPIAMTIINIIAGAIYTKGFPFKEKAQIYGMAVIFLVILYNSPSGLVLYWTMNNVFSLIKNIFYKMKNPLKVLYYIMCAGIALVIVYILFIYSGGQSPATRVKICILLLLFVPIPLYIKGINFVINVPLAKLRDNSTQRFLMFIISAFGLAILGGIILPANLISSSVSEFSDLDGFKSPSIFILNCFWQNIGLLVFWPICIYFLFKEKIQTIIAFVWPLLLFTALINAYAFAGNYGSMDITLKFIGSMNNPTKLFKLVNIIVLAAFFCLYFFYLSKIKYSKTNLTIYLSSILTVVFIVLGFVNSTKIKKEYAEFEISKNSGNYSNPFNTKFNLSKNNKNVVLFMLDRAESAYFQQIMDEYPEIKKNFNGFTYYKNCVSYNGHTLMGAPAIYGGYEYTPDEMNKRSEVSLQDKHNEALMMLPRIFTEQADMTASVCDLSWANYDIYSDMGIVDKWPKITGYKLTGRYTADYKKAFPYESEIKLSTNIIRNLFWVSLFRSAPAFLRSVIYYRGSWWQQASQNSKNVDLILDYYSTLYYLPEVTECNADKGAYICICNEITHEDPDISGIIKGINSVSEDEKPGYTENAAALLKIGDFITYLKENDCFDNTKIIIVADHGIGYGENTSLDFNTENVTPDYKKDHLHPLLLVKDFYSDCEINTNNYFMTNADTAVLAVENVVENPVNPFTKKAVTNELKSEGALVTIEDLNQPYMSKSKNIFTVDKNSWYRIKDNIFDDKNWRKEN